MRFPFLALPFTFALLPLLALPSCTKSSTTGAPSVSCPAPFPDGGLEPFETPASGTIAGTGVSATFCNVGVPLTATAYPPTSGPFALSLDGNDPSTSSHLDLPSSAVAATLTGSIQIPAPTPGVYKSTDATVCGSLSFSYGVPLSGADCAPPDAESFTCAAGCSISFLCPPSSQSGSCCLPLATTYIFQAVSATTCGAAAPGTALGSWTLTVTSVATEDDAGPYEQGPVYLPHGTLDATLQGTSGNDEPVSLSLSF